jgi:hypothetical protein
MRDFPYAECCLAWQDHGIAREVSVSQEPAFSDVLKALTAIGTTLRTGSDSKKKIMLDTIRARCIPPGLGQSWYWTVLGTGPLVRTASSRGGPVLDLGTGRPVLS